nr:retrovirus-related Pol polyprotein from transposon TNT 1-94 [Tanacetum cinerariifolium]
MVLEKKVNSKPINYAKLNQLSEDFGKRFVPQRELSDEQALHPITDQAASSPVKIEAPRELPKLIQELLGYVRETCPDIYKPRVNPSTSASGSKSYGNTKNHRITRTPSSNEKNKVEVQSRKVKSSLNKHNFDSKNICNEHVKHPIKGAKALCSVFNKCLFDANHAMCLIDYVNSMNVCAKSAYKKNKKRKEWKPTGKVFNSVRYKWKSTRRTFTLVGNVCLLTRRPKVPKFVQNSKPMVIKRMTANRIEPGTSRGFDTLVAPSSSSLIDCGCLNRLVIGNDTISRVYYVEGPWHNLFSVGQLCDSDLKVALRKHTCFVLNLEGVDLLLVSRGTNLYSLSIGDMMASSPIRLLSKATKTKSWLWHRRLSHLNLVLLITWLDTV